MGKKSNMITPKMLETAAHKVSISHKLLQEAKINYHVYKAELITLSDRASDKTLAIFLRSQMADAPIIIEGE